MEINKKISSDTTEEKNIKKSYFAIIPANVRYDKRLNANAKLLYGEITALCNEKGYCWANNNYFSKLYEVDQRTIIRWINQLIKYGYIYSELKYKANSKEIEYRYLKLNNTPINENAELNGKNVMGGSDKNVMGGSDKNVMGGGDKNVTDNNTSINNTSINNISKKVSKQKSGNKESNKKSFDDLIEGYTENQQLRDELKEHLKTRKLKKGALTNRAIELSLKTLNNLATNDEDKIKIVQQSIERGYIGFFPVKNEQQKPSYDIKQYRKDSEDYLMRNIKATSKSRDGFDEVLKGNKPLRTFIDVEVK